MRYANVGAFCCQRCVGPPPPDDSGSEGEERDDEKPVIVVLRKGDLDADEVAQIEGVSNKEQSAGTCMPS